MAHIESDAGIFDLPEGFAFALNKTNPLFTLLGSQTAPLELPITPRNNLALGFPARIDGYFKPRTSLPITIVDGIFSKRCTLRITGAEPNKIKGSIYFDEGEAYAKIKNVKLTELDLGGFRLQRPPGLNFGYNSPIMVFLHQVFINRLTISGYNIDNLDFDVFETLVEYGDGDNDKMLLNECAIINVNGNDIYKYRTEPRDIKQNNEDGEEITIKTGANYGISPFLRVHALLRLIFQSIGYTLTENPFVTHPQLAKLVVLNNTADTVMNGVINYKHIVPDCTVNDFLDAIWAKFGAILYLNSDTKEAKIHLVNNLLQTTADTDFTGKLSSNITRTFAIPKQLCLIPQTGMVSEKINYKSVQELTEQENVEEYAGTVDNPAPPNLPKVFLRLIDGTYWSNKARMIIVSYQVETWDNVMEAGCKVDFTFSEPVENVSLSFTFGTNNSQPLILSIPNFTGISGSKSGSLQKPYDVNDPQWFYTLNEKSIIPSNNGNIYYFFQDEQFDYRKYLSKISSAHLAWKPNNKDLENEELQAKDECYDVLSRWNGDKLEDNQYVPIYVTPILKGDLIHRNSYLKINGVIKENQSGESKLIFAFGMEDANSLRTFRCGSFMPFNNNNQISGWNFGLIYQGNFGLYKHFFEKYDNFLHHANELYECTMRLSKVEFLQLNIEKPILIHGQPCLIESITFPFGEDGDSKVKLRSLRLMNNNV